MALSAIYRVSYFRVVYNILKRIAECSSWTCRRDEVTSLRKKQSRKKGIVRVTETDETETPKRALNRDAIWNAALDLFAKKASSKRQWKRLPQQQELHGVHSFVNLNQKAT